MSARTLDCEGVNTRASCKRFTCSDRAEYNDLDGSENRAKDGRFGEAEVAQKARGVVLMDVFRTWPGVLALP